MVGAARDTKARDRRTGARPQTPAVMAPTGIAATRFGLGAPGRATAGADRYGMH